MPRWGLWACAMWGCGLVWAAPASAPPAARTQPEIGAPVPTLQARRGALLERIGSGTIILRGADPADLDEHPQASDFRQSNDFYYLTALETPGSWLVLVAREAGPDSSILYLPPRDPREERWTGPRLGPGAEAVERAGVSAARSREELEVDLQRRLAAVGSGPVYLPMAGASAPYDAVRGLLAQHGAETRDLGPVLASLRLVKDSVEIARLRRAIAITVEAQREAMRAAEPGTYEYELEALIEYVFRRAGAERVGFPSIVGSGPNSVVLHYDQSRRRMGADDVVVVDVGAEYDYYSADVTRTYPVRGTFTPRQREVYELVLAAQQATIDAVRPGVTMAELNTVARRYLREHSRGVCGARTCDAYFVHGVGHWLGMNVHDVGDYATPLRPGMVLTIEPGIYLSEESLGVRIEDDLLVTPNGAEVLSGDAPRTVAEIEALMRQGKGPAPRAAGGAP